MAEILERLPVENATNQPLPHLYTKLATFLLLLSFFTVYGCALAVIGLGAGAGAAAFYGGKLTKTYQSDYHETVRAGKDTLRRLKIPITETIGDELKTEIKAARPDGTPVTIEIVRIDSNHNEVSVRTGSVGVTERRVSEQIHSNMSQALGQKFSAQDLAKDTETATTYTAGSTGSDLPALEEKRLRAAQMLVDSIFFIFFEENSNALSPRSIEKLDQIYAILASDPTAGLKLNGYSDSSGTREYNQMISEIRANAVKSYLAGKGILPSRMTSMGHGARNFIASNKTAEGRRMNSRVEIEIVNSSQ